MPEISGFIDSLRDAFGREEIQNAMRVGVANGTFWAMEGEFVFGNPPQSEVQAHLKRIDDAVSNSASAEMLGAGG